jgi:hypothetical protein
MRVRSLPIRSAALVVVWIAIAPAGAGGPARADDPPEWWEEPCIVSPDNGPIAVTGVLGRGCADCWGEYRVSPDPGIRAWDITRDCSIETDWESLLGKRVHLEGTAFMVRGGIGGTLGAALGVARIEVLTPTLPMTWGRVRSLYR